MISKLKMAKMTVSSLALAVVLVAAVGVAQAQVKKGKTRAMTTGQFMKQVIKPQCESLKKGLDAAPANDEAWAALAAHAAVLNEGSYLLMDDGRCPYGIWAEAASKLLRQGSADVLSAVDVKDLAAAKEAFGRMTKACGSCHDTHKEKK